MAGAFGNSGFGGGGGGFGSRLRSWVQGLPNRGLYNSWLGNSPGGATPPASNGGGVLGQPGFVANNPGSGGVQNAPGSAPIGGEQPFPSNSTTGGVGTTMQPNTGGLEPAPYGGMGSPAPTNELPPQLAGTGGVRSPYGPYGPPGFIGSVPTGGAEPYNPGNSTTGGALGAGYYMPPDALYQTSQGGGGVGTTMGPAGTGGLEPRPPNPSIWNPSNPKPGTPEWMTSPQGQQAQWQAAVGNSPFKALYPNQGQYPQPHARPQPGPGEGYVSPNAGMTRQEAQAASQANWNNPQWVMQQVLAGKVAPQNNEQLQAMLANMSPEDRQAYIDRYKSIGLDPTFQGGGSGGIAGPFGS